jgi:tetratricopeptide (TPR) repeat protein
VADQTDKTSDKKAPDSAEAKPSAAAPRFDPKPVNVGGESLVDRLYPHRKKIGLFIATGAVIWGVVAVVIHFKDSGAEKATDKLAVVLDLGDKPVKAAEPVGSGSAAAPVTDSFPDVKTRANALLDALAKQGTHAAGPVYRASLLVQAGKLDDAIAEYKQAQGELGLDGVLAREGLGLAQEQKAEDPKNDAATRQKGLEEALATFQSMQPDDRGPRRDFSLYHQGRIQVLLGKSADAKASFDKAKDLAKNDPELAELVEQRLASLGT